MIQNVTIGQYFPGNSFMHRLDARLKLVLTITLIVLIFFIHSVWGYVSVTVLLMLMIISSKVSFKFVLKSIKSMWLVILIAFVLNAFFVKGETTLFQWSFIHIYTESVLRATEMAVRLILLVLISTMLTFTTSAKEITDAIESLFRPLAKIKFPVHEMALMMSIALRFIPTLVEETDRIMKAQTARGASFDSGSLISRMKDMLPVLIPLFISAFKRAEELALAMEARCYHGGENRTRLKVFKLGGIDYIAMIIIAAQIVFIALGY